MFPCSCEGKETPTLLASLERGNLNHWNFSFFWGIQHSRCLPPLTWRRIHILFPKLRVFLLFRSPDNGQRPDTSDTETDDICWQMISWRKNHFTKNPDDDDNDDDDDGFETNANELCHESNSL
jgi:hypothetical protein